MPDVRDSYLRGWGTGAINRPILVRKKPVEVEAMYYDGSEDAQRAIVNWSGGKVSGWFGDPEMHLNNGYYLRVATLEGPVDCDIGHWVIKGIKGEFYSCESEIFEMTYERVPIYSE